MQKSKISIVVAVTGKNAAIGNGGKLLVRISEDLKRFKTLTKGHPVIMGRKTFESIGRPLPERTNFVVTRNPDFRAEGVVVVNSLEEALQKAASLLPPSLEGGLEGGANGKHPYTSPLSLGSPKDFPSEEGQGQNEIFIIGGGEIYKQGLPYTDKLYLTLVESDAEGDVFFPDWRKDFTKETFREERFDEKTGLKYTWVDLERG
ncbi:MAG: Dihydrofolate reductase [Parcubacteria group bacterium GW2011_GWA2_49_9]|nr:MAG: Dihydrofolate reductase [Parcubacteria group bacterium GW2011_GWA2_49_9]